MLVKLRCSAKLLGITFAWVCMLPAAPTARADIVAYYRFENSGDLGLDETGSHHGVLANGATQSSSVGQNPIRRTGTGNTSSLNLDFTAPPDHVVVPAAAALDSGNRPWTIEAFLRLDTAPTTSTVGMYVVQKKEFVSDNFQDYALLLSGQRGALSSGVRYFDNGSYNATGRNLQVEFGNGTEILAFRSNLVAPQSGWAHVSAAYDGDRTVRFTLDTNLDDNMLDSVETIVAGSTVVPTVNAGTLLIGAKKNAQGNVVQGFDGFLDEVRISNMQLGLSELLAVPEPSTLILAALGACGLVALARRREKSTS